MWKVHVIHGNIVENAYDLDPMLSFALVKMYGKSKSLDDIKYIFDKMPYVDIVSWNSMVDANVDKDPMKKHLIFSIKCNWKASIQIVLHLCMLEACASLVVLDKGEKIHTTINGCEGDLIVRNNMHT